MAIGAVLGLGKTLVFAKVLGPDELSYYGYVLLVNSYGSYLCAWGLLSGLNVELPLAYGRRDDNAARLTNEGLSALVAGGIATAAMFVVIVLLVGFEQRTELVLVLASGTTLVMVASSFVILLLRVRQESVRMATAYATRAGLVLVTGVGAGLVWGYLGVIVAEIITVGVVTVWFARVWVRDVRPASPRAETIKRLVATGTPLTIANLIVAGSITIDRLFVAGELPDLLGQYTFAWIVVTVALVVLNMLSQFVTPRLLHQRGAGASLQSIRKELRKLLAYVLLAGAACFPLFVLATSWLADGIFEEYEPGISVMPILYVGGVAAITTIYGTLLLAARRFSWVTYARAVGVAVGLTGAWIVSATEASLTAFAWVFTGTQVVSAIAVFGVSQFAVRGDVR